MIFSSPAPHHDPHHHDLHHRAAIEVVVYAMLLLLKLRPSNIVNASANTNVSLKTTLWLLSRLHGQYPTAGPACPYWILHILRRSYRLNLSVKDSYNPVCHSLCERYLCEKTRGGQFEVKHVLEQNLAAKTCGAQFEVKDIYVIVFSRTSILCKIRASAPTLLCILENKLLDLKKMHQTMAAKYQLDGHFPPHFECLEKDIYFLDASTIDRSSVLQYLPYHVALMSLGANDYLTEKLYKILDESIDPVQEDTSNTFIQEDTSNTVLHEDTSNTLLQENTSQDNSSSSAASVKQKFKRTRRGKLAFKRHLDVYLDSHMAGKRPLRGMFQAEAYSSKNNDVLGDIFIDLFSGPSIKLLKFLELIMKHYPLLRDMDDE
ncbi:hypothetical protein ZWY2020_032554 [Hordeum vulgare]|nr:hypothetical protein ZWY2020_032554 [Hordeum vulgare]